MMEPNSIAEASEVAPLGVERRRYRRVRIGLEGRFMRQDRTEHPCTLSDISVAAAALTTPVRMTPGERVVCYLNEIGRIEGPVYRVLDTGFVVTIEATDYRRNKMAAQLMWLINREALDPAMQRREGHDRIPVNTAAKTLALPDGTTEECRVLDISISGAAVDCQARPAVGSLVQLANLRGRVVRVVETGIAIEFIDIQRPHTLRKKFAV